MKCLLFFSFGHPILVSTIVYSIVASNDNLSVNSNEIDHSYPDKLGLPNDDIAFNTTTYFESALNLSSPVGNDRVLRVRWDTSTNTSFAGLDAKCPFNLSTNFVFNVDFINNVNSSIKNPECSSNDKKVMPSLYVENYIQHNTTYNATGETFIVVYNISIVSETILSGISNSFENPRKVEHSDVTDNSILNTTTDISLYNYSNTFTTNFKKDLFSLTPKDTIEENWYLLNNTKITTLKGISSRMYIIDIKGVNATKTVKSQVVLYNTIYVYTSNSTDVDNNHNYRATMSIILICSSILFIILLTS